MKYIEIKGDASDKELDLIRKNIEKDSNSVFLYTGFGTIYDYIETIGRDLGDELLYRFKICYEKRGLKAEYSDNTGNGKKMTQSMTENIAAVLLLNQISVPIWHLLFSSLYI